MKSRLILLAVLLVCAVGAAVYAGKDLDKTHIPAPLTAEYEWGDRSAAEGLTLDTELTVSNLYLEWDSRYWVGSGESVTDFSGLRHVPTAMRNMNDWRNDPDEPVYTYYIVPRFLQSEALREEMKSLSSSENEVTCTVRLADYYQEIPLVLSAEQTHVGEVSVWDYYGTADLVGRDGGAFDKLHIPMPEDATAQVTLSKSNDGSSYRYQLSSLQNTGVTSYSLALGIDGGTLITEVFPVDATPEADWAPEGFGLWWVPVRDETVEVDRAAWVKHTPDVSAAKLVYPLDISAQRVVNLCFDYDHSHILLVTAEDGQFFLHVLDSATYAPVQVLPLCKAGIVAQTISGDVGVARTVTTFENVYLRAGEGFVAIACGDTLVVLIPDGNGYREAFTCPLVSLVEVQQGDSEAQTLWSSDLSGGEDRDIYTAATVLSSSAAFEDTPMCYRDGKLAMAFYRFWSDPNPIVQVYGKEGLLYAAQVTSDLSRQYYGDYSITPVSNIPGLTWE